MFGAPAGALGGAGQEGVESAIVMPIFIWFCPRDAAGGSVDRGHDRLSHRFRLRFDGAQNRAQARPQVVHLIE